MMTMTIMALVRAIFIVPVCLLTFQGRQRSYFVSSSFVGTGVNGRVAHFKRLHRKFSLRDNNRQERSAVEEYEVLVIMDGKQKCIFARENETLLSALERSGLHFQAPHDCRRGNCLTCCGKLLKGTRDSIREDRDTFLSAEAHAEGLMLLCSSFADGPGLCIEVGQNDLAWNISLRNRFINEETKRIGHEATAKAMRKDAERNPRKFVEHLDNLFLEE